jgi:hypothetical protein
MAMRDWSMSSSRTEAEAMPLTTWLSRRRPHRPSRVVKRADISSVPLTMMRGIHPRDSAKRARDHKVEESVQSALCRQEVWALSLSTADPSNRLETLFCRMANITFLCNEEDRVEDRVRAMTGRDSPHWQSLAPKH